MVGSFLSNDITLQKEKKVEFIADASLKFMPYDDLMPLNLNLVLDVHTINGLCYRKPAWALKAFEV